MFNLAWWGATEYSAPELADWSTVSLEIVSDCSLGSATWSSWFSVMVGDGTGRVENWRMVGDRNITSLELICVSTPDKVRLNLHFIRQGSSLCTDSTWYPLRVSRVVSCYHSLANGKITCTRLRTTLGDRLVYLAVFNLNPEIWF